MNNNNGNGIGIGIMAFAELVTNADAHDLGELDRMASDLCSASFGEPDVTGTVTRAVMRRFRLGGGHMGQLRAAVRDGLARRNPRPVTCAYRRARAISRLAA